MKELNQHKFKFNPYLEDLYQSDKPLIIYKVDDGYNIYTDFSKKIILTKKNIHKFLNSLEKKKYKKETDLYLGFFGYEILCNLIGINLKNKKRINFYKGIFYKPETIIKIRKDIKVISNIKKHTFNYQFNKTQILSPFKVNISYTKYKKIFELFSKKIREGETYQIKICTKYKNESLINPINFFWKLMRVNSSPESFMIKDKDYSIVSCSPETLIDKKKNKIITKPIAGTFKKKILSNKNIALKYFKNNEKETKEHNMIVDMERSDLSKICKPGSVKILKKKYVEEYKHLFHYVTSIGGILKKNTKLIDIIKAMMPGGSVIGCPKIRTLELLNNQEKESRNIFTGSFGLIKFNQDMKFNIIIRSILNYKNQSEISAASGVVLDSSPKKEFNENYIKAKSLLELFK
ncbi:chorismate-binding protein [Candidatus Pelagibacter sp. FZCC0015]|uniref:chorismate-binding protein n=1 Tax=Candidatus Pelagibacter sp. FZCC0015 TaxID=2268451 RepID=UPI0011AA7505|nr:chorismate-binding protein [Candidatus Pelagibacter sp. FZCC0015]